MLQSIFYSFMIIPTFIPNKANSVQNYMAYRTEVPGFYQQLKQNLPKLKTLNQISTLDFCAGDAHPTNFGFILLNNQKVTLTYNDYDDSGICPLISDLTRFLVGAKYLSQESGYKGISMSELLDTYQKALKGHQLKLSNDLIKYLNNQSPKDFLPSHTQFQENKLQIKSDMQRVTNMTLYEQIKNVMIHEFEELSQYEMTDLASRTKLSGGSREQTRYLSLWINYKNQKPLILELKPITEPSVVHITKQPYSEIELTLAAWDFFIGPEIGPWYRIIKFNGSIYKSRPLYAKQGSFEFEKVSDHLARDLLHLEAAILGGLHNRLNNKEYVRLLEKVDSKALLDDIKAFSNIFYDWLREKYKANASSASQ